MNKEISWNIQIWVGSTKGRCSHSCRRPVEDAPLDELPGLKDLSVLFERSSGDDKKQRQFNIIGSTISSKPMVI